MHGLISQKSYCPYCGESIELLIDNSIPEQEYIEDCQVCCRPMIIKIQIDSEGDINLCLRSENE